MNIDEAKRAVGRAAAGHVTDHMRVGLGTGTTVRHTIVELGRRVVEEGLVFTAVSTSEATTALALQHSITLVALDGADPLDLGIGGADAFDPDLNTVKSGRGSLLREKIVAQAGQRLIVVCDARKQVPILGDVPLPVEVVPFGWQHTAARLSRAIGARTSIHRQMGLPDAFVGGIRVPATRLGGPVVTDQGNLVIDLHTGPTISDPAGVEACLHSVAGVVATGLFVGICDMVLVGGHGGVRTVRRRSPGAIE